MMVSTVIGVLYILSNRGINVAFPTHPQQHLLFVSLMIATVSGVNAISV
jgi:hypothetical protein